MDKETLRLLEELKKKEIEKMKAMGEQDEFDLPYISEEDKKKLDINRRLAEGIEKDRRKEIEQKIEAENFRKKAERDLELKKQKEHEAKVRAMRLEEYNNEIKNKGYVNKYDYLDLFPELESEISPLKEEDKRKKQMGYK